MTHAAAFLRRKFAATLLVMTYQSAGALGGNTVDCIENTGGTCLTDSCSSWRGPTRCSTGRCWCAEGTCAGGDGVCTSTPYEPVAVGNVSHFKLRNARWPEYYMDVDLTGHVDVEKDSSGADNRFTLSMPGFKGGEEPLRAPVFLIASVKWPDSVLKIVWDDDKDGYTADVRGVDGGFGGLGADPSVQQLGMLITLAPDASPEGEYPVMLSSYELPNKYLYVSSLGWEVSPHGGDPGAGGYWFFEPMLPDEVRSTLLSYSGSRCSFSCGDVASSNVTASAATLSAQSSWGGLLTTLALAATFWPLSELA